MNDSPQVVSLSGQILEVGDSVLLLPPPGHRGVIIDLVGMDEAGESGPVVCCVMHADRTLSYVTGDELAPSSAEPMYHGEKVVVMQENALVHGTVDRRTSGPLEDEDKENLRLLHGISSSLAEAVGHILHGGPDSARKLQRDLFQALIEQREATYRPGDPAITLERGLAVERHGRTIEEAGSRLRKAGEAISSVARKEKDSSRD